MRRGVEHAAGERFGRLTVICLTRVPGRSGRFYTCRCDCGNETRAYGAHLRNGSRKSCGCIRPAPRTHGMSFTPEHRAWSRAKERCYRPANPRYEHYGARGIVMCEAWRNSFEAFLADMGLRPSPKHSIDRIDNDGNYEPSNCRWATSEEQNNNRSINRFVIVDGQRLTVAQASRKTGLTENQITYRLRRGDSPEEAARV